MATKKKKADPRLDPAAAFGRLLREARMKQKLSQEAVAARAGCERAFISLVELGKTNPSLRSIFDICSAVGIRPAVFLGRVERASNFTLPQSP